jgi:hypothetical protein
MSFVLDELRVEFGAQRRVGKNGSPKGERRSG